MTSPSWVSSMRITGLCLLLLVAHDVGAAPSDLVQRGEDAFRRGDFGAAVSAWEAARQQQAVATLRLTLRLAVAQRELGDVEAARVRLESALAEDLDSAMEAGLRGELGAVHLRRGAYPAAERELARALTLAESAQLPGVGARAYLRRAELRALLDAVPLALADYREAAVMAEQAGDTLTRVGALVGAAALLAGDQPAAAAAALEQAEGVRRNDPASHQKAMLLLAAGLVHRDLAVSAPGQADVHLAAALRCFQSAAAMARGLEDQRVIAYAEGYAAGLYEAQGRLTEALILNRRARFAAQQLGADEVAFRWEWQAGRLLKGLGRSDEAVQAYRQAVRDLQSVRHALLADLKPGENFRDSLGKVYFELADLLLRRADADTDPQRRQDDLREVRNTLELFKTAELEDYFRDDCVAAFEARVRTLEQVGRQVAVIYPVLLPDRTELLLHLNGVMHRFTVPVDQATLQEAVGRFRRLLEKRISRQYLRPARELYQWLLRPMQPLLEQADVQTLVFVPDGILRTIPLSALHDGRQFVVQRYAVAVTPGMELTGQGVQEAGDPRALVGGLGAAVQGFPPLPNAQQEIDGVARRFGATALVDQSFVLDAVGRELEDTSYSLVHIASHGQFSKDFAETFLLTYDGRLTLDMLARHLRSGRYRDRPVELLTLSACQTAAGDDRAALGLAGVAVKSGAASALASLWFINDQASARLVLQFYRALAEPGVSKAEALRRAQLELMKDPRFRHPAYWAPFLLIGNWV